MVNLSSATVQSFCRACLKELKKQHKCKIFSLNLQIRNWLEDATLDTPFGHDKYPNYICHSCKKKLKEFLEFHKMYKQSRKTIQKILANDEKMLAYDLLTTCKDYIKTDPNSGVIDEEALCKSSNPSHRGIEELHKNNISDELDGSGRIHTDFESDIQSEDNNNKNSTRKEYITAVKTDPNFPNAKTNRKKYTYSFRCDQCKHRCVSQQTLDIHIRTHYGLKPFQCPKCSDSFDKSTFLLKHLNDIHGEKELYTICEYEECGKQFTSSRNYKDHYRQYHIPQQSNPKQDKPKAKTPHRHVCEECGKIYTKLQTFKEHLYTHGPKDLYPFQCDECDKAFVKQRTFNEHKLRHAGIKNFECSHCGAKKTTKKELRSHMNSHTRERKYPCPNCPMTFYRSSNRRIHVDVVHQGIRRFACRFCDQTFGKGDNLKNHELLHTGEKPHACTECGKRFVQRVSLRSHIKTHNK